MQLSLQTDYCFPKGYIRAKFMWFGSMKNNSSIYRPQNAFRVFLLSLSLFFISSLNLMAQPAIQWDRTIGGPVSSGLASSQQTADGGYILGGTSSVKTGLDKTDPGKGDLDYWIVKLSADGVKQWDHSYGGPGEDNFTTMQQTADGGYILAGYSSSDAGGDKSENYRGGLNSDGFRTYDIWVIKIAADGTRVWDKTLGGSRSESVNAIVQTTDGGYILSGTSNSDIGLDKTGPVLGGMDFWVVKLAANGDKQWDKTYGTSRFEQNSYIKQTGDGGYILGGTTNDYQPDRSADYMVIRIAPDGTKIWEKIFGGTGVDELHNIITTSDGGYLVAGYSNSLAGGDKSEAPQVHPDEDYSRFFDYWILKLAPDGTKEWDRTIGGTIYDEGGYFSGESYLRSTYQTTDGGYLLGGHSNARQGRSKTENNKGKNDYWIVKIDAKGSKLWDKTIGGNDNDELRSVFQTSDGGCFLAGSSFSSASADKAESKKGTGSDYWVVKLAAEQQPFPQTSVRINAGGQAFAASGGRQFIADQYFAGIDRTSSIASGDILHTTDDVLYRSGRCSPSFSYNIPMANGKVNVILHFAETWFGVPGRGPGGAGKRQFHVTMEGSRKLTNFDIFAAAGGAMLAVQKSIPVTIADGVLNIDFTSGAADLPRISAIEVVRTSLTLKPLADAYVRDGSYRMTNFGAAANLDIKNIAGDLSAKRTSYLRFQLPAATVINAAKLRIYGHNHENSKDISVHAYGVDNDSWTENGIVKSNAPAASTPSLGYAAVNDVYRYYEVDVTKYVKAQLQSGETLVSLMLADPNNRNTRVILNSRENSINPPQLIVQTPPVIKNNTRLNQQEISTEPETEQSSVYPNPAGKQFTVSVSTKHSGSISLDILSNAGQSYPIMTTHMAIAGQKAEADISALSLKSGIYLLRIHSQAATEVIKILVND
ncbi:DNRLRE domain-containing protein [Dyadobacter flavalbus]|uniref:DNRLRE domain-containing protein n=1 Tax=Dyadobacter flavalbus TaxID=2579942 RepID=A0A5M8QSD8_9BACT|nr:malectin domain-containing carbohydrate-binding protein [Dyadobacter flavalbus]KAA6438999.1 DNRLRE domain-containing protein [Dyadobacter flavalbus]